MRLIDADTIFNGKLLMVRAEAYDAVHAVVEKINNTPTVDAVPVVRCKDCKNYVWHDHRCVKTNHGFRDDFFCAWGERREEG